MYRNPHLGGPVRPLINCPDYMGLSSSWSFCRRVLSIIGKQIPEGSVPRDPWHLDGSAFEFRWPTDEFTQPASLGCVPSQEYVLLLCSLKRFNLGSFAGLLGHDRFQAELHLFYNDPDGYASEHRLWFTKYLLVAAFGQAFSRRERSGELPGANYAGADHQAYSNYNRMVYWRSRSLDSLQFIYSLWITGLRRSNM